MKITEEEALRLQVAAQESAKGLGPLSIKKGRATRLVRAATPEEETYFRLWVSNNPPSDDEQLYAEGLMFRHGFMKVAKPCQS